MIVGSNELNKYKRVVTFFVITLLYCGLNKVKFDRIY